MLSQLPFVGSWLLLPLNVTLDLPWHGCVSGLQADLVEHNFYALTYSNRVLTELKQGTK